MFSDIKYINADHACEAASVRGFRMQISSKVVYVDVVTRTRSLPDSS